MNTGRREFLGLAAGAAAIAAVPSARAAEAPKGRILLGACRPLESAKVLKSIGYDFIEGTVGLCFVPDKGEEAWKRQREKIQSLPLPLRSCAGFLPASLRLTGPKADHEKALAYAETALRRADEVGVPSIVFGSGGARNVPGDFCGKNRPDIAKGVRQYAEFCRKLCARVADLKTVQIVIEPLRANESNIINFVWQGVKIVREVNSPRLRQLADIYHMIEGDEGPESIVRAGDLLKHCHIAAPGTRSYPGSGKDDAAKLKPYFEALRSIGYTGGVSCECGWGAKKDTAKNLERAFALLKSL